MKFKDYYNILGISKGASDQVIKTAYRKLARQYHPDLNPGNKSAEEKFKSINEAYEVLENAEKRKKYDELGANWEQVLRDREYAQQYTRPGFQSHAMDDINLGDFFETFFGERVSPFGGGFRSARTYGPRPGEDIETEIELSFEEIAQGIKKQIRLSGARPCTQCQGEGYVAVSTSETGRGRIVKTMKPCPTCRGQGEMADVRVLDVTIPKGLMEGSRLRLSGQGNKGEGGARSGDLYLRIKLRPHRFFRLEGHDLYADLPLLDDEAALGTKLQVPTLKGPVQLTIPPETQSGQLLRLKGQGLPKRGREGAGNLYFHVKIQIPNKLSQAERELYTKLQRIRSSQGNGNAIRKWTL